MVRSVAMLGLLLLLSPSAALAKDFEQRVAAQSGGTLYVDLDSGTVEVESHDAEVVRVNAPTELSHDAVESLSWSRSNGSPSATYSWTLSSTSTRATTSKSWTLAS